MNFSVFPRRRLAAAVLVVLLLGVGGTLSVLADYGHPIVDFFPNPLTITFPRSGRIILWNHILSNSPEYFSRYYFIRNGCQVGQTCTYMDVVNSPSVLTPLTVSAGETVQIQGCDCYGGDCGAGGCAYPHVGWKTTHHSYFCPNYFSSPVYNPSAGGTDFTGLMTAFLASGDALIGTPQCWGDWDEGGSNGNYDHDFEDFVLLWAYHDTFTGYHDGSSGTVSSAQCRAYGWVMQNEVPGQNIRYRIVVDGVERASGTANQYRADLEPICPDGTCGYNHNLWGLVTPNTLHTIRVQAQNPYTTVWFDLSGTGRTIRCSLPPEVDLTVNNQDGPLNISAPAAYTLRWTSANADTCTASGRWSGSKNQTGTEEYTGIPLGTYTYTLTCANSIGSASDSVTIQVSNPPLVDLKVNHEDGPLTLPSPASYTLSWTSQNASTCSAASPDGRWTGSVAGNGSQYLEQVPSGGYEYTITCSNGAQSVRDSVTVDVVSALRGTISASFSKLVLFAPRLGQPTQALSGTVSGGTPPYSIVVRVRTPSGLLLSFDRDDIPWWVTASNSGDPNFGTTEAGGWTAWAEITDSAGQTYRTFSVIWEVSWHPVYGEP